MTISIMVLVCWLTVGVINLASCITKRECRWIVYWFVYVVLIVNLIDDVIVKFV